MEPFTKTLGISYPIVQAPMAGANATPPALVAAVCEAGGLGFIGAAYMSPDQIAEAGRETRRLTSKPFGVNLFTPVESKSLPSDASRAIATIATYHAELGLPQPALPRAPAFSFADQLQAALECGARVFSFTFGVLPADTISHIKSREVFVIGTATTVREGVILERAGVDAVVAQGAEAGAHRGTFDAPFESAMVGGLALVPQMVDALEVPVIASGGIMDGRGIAAALALGAEAVQMGTAFLTCDECGVAAGYKDAVLGAQVEQTRLTRAFSGRPARGIVNRAMSEIEATPDGILPYPHQNALTRPLRNAAATRNRPEFLSLWAGQGAPLARRESASRLVHRLVEETRATIEGLQTVTL